MKAQRLSVLVEEIRVFSGFRYPEEVKQSVNEFLLGIKTNSPSNSTNVIGSTLIKCCRVILSSKKILNQTFPLINAILDCISAECIAPSVMPHFLKLLEVSYINYDANMILKIIQTVSSLIARYLGHLHVIRSLFSIILRLTTHSDVTVSTTAFACFQQMITVEFSFVSNSSSLNYETSDLIVEYSKIAPSKFSNPLYIIPFLILNDLLSLLQNKKTSWLRVEEIDHNLALELWTIIISTHHEFLKQCPQLIQIVSSLTSFVNYDPLSISLLASIIYHHTSDIADSCYCVSKLFLKGLSPKSEQNHSSLLFFRYLLFIGPNFLPDFFTNCDNNCSIIIPLFEQLNSYCDYYLSSNLVVFNMDQINISDVNQKNSLLSSAPIEISLWIMLSPPSNQSIILFSSIWRLLLTILIKAIRYSELQSCEIIFQAINSFIGIFSKINNAHGKGVLLRILCSIVSNQKILRQDPDSLELLSNSLLHSNKKGFLFKQKRALTYQFLIKLLNSNPQVFEKCFSRVFYSIGSYPGAKIDPSFALLLDDNGIACLVRALSKGNAFTIQTLESVILIPNRHQLMIIYETKNDLIQQLQSSESETAVINLYSNTLPKLFTPSSELEILELVYCLIEKQSSSQSNSSLIRLYELLSVLVKNFTNIISKGWIHVLSSINNSYCVSFTHILDISFSILSCICTDCFAKMGDIEKEMCIDIIFVYVFQKVDFNVSLSALGLMWNIMPSVHTHVKFWMQVLNGMLTFFHDSRSDIASGALSTFFALLSSNVNQMPLEIFPHLITNCFMPLLMTFDSFESGSWVIQGNAILAIEHCACTFWEQFSNSSHFLSAFWPLLIEKQYLFMQSCGSQEVASTSLLFYEECFQCQSLTKVFYSGLLTSFEAIVLFLLEKEPHNSLVISGFGRLLGKILPLQIQHIDENNVLNWLSIIKRISTILPSPTFINITTYKCLSSMISILPLSKTITIKVMDIYSQIFSESESIFVKENISQMVAKLIDRIPKDYVFSVISFFTKFFDVKQTNLIIESIISLSIQKGDEKMYYHLLNSIQHMRIDYKESCIRKMIHYISDIEPENQKSFIIENKSNKLLLIDIWSNYCDPSKSSFSSQFFNDCFHIILESIMSRIIDSNDIVQVLTYILSVSVPPVKFGTLDQYNRWHIHKILYPLMELANCDDDSVKEITKSMLTTIIENTQLIIK